MKTNSEFDSRFSYASTVFNADFNNFAPINANQAWSLFLTAGRDDAALGDNPEVGRFFNNILKAVVFTAIISPFVFRTF